MKADSETGRLVRLGSRAVRSRWPPVILVLAVGALLSVAFFQVLERAESDRVALDFRRDASDRVAGFRVSLTHALDSLFALEGLFSISPQMSRGAFRSFVGKHFLHEPGVESLGWAPRVAREELADFERRVRAEAVDLSAPAREARSFSVFEIAEGEPRRPGSRREYFPLLYGEPSGVGLPTPGLDLASDDAYGQALTRARSTSGMGVSLRLTLRPDAPDELAVVVARSVHADASASPATGGPGELLGFVVGTFAVGSILDGALGALEPRGIDIAVHDLGHRGRGPSQPQDLDASPSESLLHYHPSRLQLDGASPWTAADAEAWTGLGMAQRISVGDREWLVSCRPTVGYLTARGSWLPTAGLLGGLLLTTILALAFFTVMGREAQTRRYARDLLRAKRTLEREAVERERARAELAVSEQRFRRTFGGSPIGTAAAELDGGFLQVNPALCRMLGYSEEELLGMNIADVTHPDDREAEKLQLELLVQGEAESVQYVERLRRGDGKEIWAELNISVVRDEAGRALYFVGQQQDTTERRRASERLRQMQETQQRILDSLPLNVFLKDSRGRMQFLNAKGRELLGLEPEEVVGKTDFDLLPEEEAKALRAVDREVLESGRALSREEVVSVGGRAVHLLTGKIPIEVDDSDEPYLLGFSIDITPIKRAEEALARSEHRFRQLVENMSSGVAVYEAVDNGTDFVFQDYNRAAERMDGRQRSEVLGRRVTEVFPGVEEMGLLDLFRKAWRTGEPQSQPVTLYQDSRIQSWRENYVYRLPSGEIVAIYDDVSDRKRLEAELLHAQKMEAVGRLAGGIAHDFNNLLQVVAGNADLLLDGSADGRARDRLLRDIQEQASRGRKLVRRLLMFSRREGYAPASLDLQDVLRGAESLVRRLMKENIELEFGLPDTPLPVEGDAGQLEQVLMNLVVNASDAMPQGGRLSIAAGVEGSSEVWFSVADSGSGIPEEVLDNVFDPYFTTKAAAQGTGLGLAVVDGIVSLHGGRIEVDNRPGEGVEFRVVLPRAQRPAATPEPEPAPAPGAGSPGQRVLVVEDQPLVRATIEGMLSSLGHDVITAADGATARRLAAEATFDLLVSDIVLPDAVGVDLAQELRSERPRLAVLLVSGYADERVRERGAGFRFLEKPFRLEDLERQVSAALEARPSAAD